MNQSVASCYRDIGKDNTKSNFTMGNSPLRVVKKERGLGVVAPASDILYWEEHTQGMTGKAKQMTSWIIRNVVSRKPGVLIPFYKASLDSICSTQCR